MEKNKIEKDADIFADLVFEWWHDRRGDARQKLAWPGMLELKEWFIKRGKGLGD